MMGPKRKRQDSSTATPSSELSEDSDRLINKLFEKHFSYTTSEESPWVLPESVFPESLVEPWNVEELIGLKKELNDLKDKLSDKELTTWNKHTSFRNVAGHVVQTIKRGFYPEFCTQAWCKFYEILSSFPILSLTNCNLNTVHLCEAPGAFVASLNHFLASKGYHGNWQWIASTLNPYYEGNSLGQMIDDVRLLRNTLIQWEFGRSNTGDIMNWDNVSDLLEVTDSLQPVHLVTADGSINCQDNPDEQEQVVSHLHYCEALTALLMLAPGGALVIKVFTMFESSSICLIYLLNCLFDQVHAFKPATSKSGNSEVYVICCGFLGLQDREAFVRMTKLFTVPDNPDGCIFNQENIPKSFLEQHIECCKLFKAHQGETIQSNLDTYGTTTAEDECEMNNLKDYFAEIFVEHYHLRLIKKCQKMVKRDCMRRKIINCVVPPVEFNKQKIFAGTLIDRKENDFLPWEKKVYTFQEYTCPQGHSVVWRQTNEIVAERDENILCCLEGRPLTEICSSRFCHSTLLSEMRELLQHSKWDAHQEAADCGTDVGLVTAALEALDGALLAEKYVACVHIFCMSNSVDDSIITAMERKIGTQVQVVDESTDLAASEDTHNILYLTVASPGGHKYPELISRIHLFKGITYLYKNWEHVSSVIIQMNTALTRFTAGLLYLLNCSFNKVGMLQQPAGVTLSQFIICTNKTTPPLGIVSHLTAAGNKMSSGDGLSSVLEVVPVHCVLNDSQFSKWLRTGNETLVKSFITGVLQAEKKLYDKKLDSS